MVCMSIIGHYCIVNVERIGTCALHESLFPSAHVYMCVLECIAICSRAPLLLILHTSQIEVRGHLLSSTSSRVLKDQTLLHQRQWLPSDYCF